MTTQKPESYFHTQPDKLHKTLAYYAAFVGVGLAAAAIGPTLPSLAAHTGTELRQVSILFTAQSTGYLLGSLQAGRLFDRFPGHPIMAVCLLFVAAMVALVPVMTTLLLLAAVLFFLGLASGTLDVGGNTLLVWVHRDRVGPFMNGLHFAFGLGSFIAPIVIAQLVLMSGDIYWAYWALALLILPAAVWLASLASPSSEVTVEEAAKGSNHKLVLLIAIFFFLNFGSEAGFGGWIYSYALKLNLADQVTAAYVTSAFWGAFTFGRLLAMPLSARIRPKVFVAADLAGVLFSLSLILLFRDSPVALWVGVMGTGLSMASIVPVTLALAERRMSISGRITSWFFVGGSVGGMTIPWLAGQLFEISGPPTAILAIGVAMAVAVMVFLPIAAVKPRQTSRSTDLT